MTNPEMIELVLAYHAALTARPNDAIFLAALERSDLSTMVLIQRSLTVEKRQVESKRLRDLEAVLDKATAAVIRAEVHLLRADVDLAALIVADLPDGDGKTALKKRLDAVRVKIADAAMANAVEVAFENILLSNIDESTTITGTLADGQEKAELLENLAIMRATIIEREAERVAYNAVSLAVITGAQDEITAAQVLVDLVSDPTIHDALQDKLDLLQDVINQVIAETAVLLAEQTHLQSDIDLAKPLVNALLDSAVKTSLLDRISLIIIQ